MKKNRIYLDNCCFNRPFDDQVLETIRLETEAKLYIQALIKNGTFRLIWSFILDFENAANPFEDKRENIAEWKNIAVEFIDIHESIRIQAKNFEKIYRLKPKDALHLACALEGKCDFFITTDKFILKRVTAQTIQVLSPIDFILLKEV